MIAIIVWQAEKTHLELEMIHKELARITRKTDEGHWATEEWLKSLESKQARKLAPGDGDRAGSDSVLGLIARALEDRRLPDQSAFEYVRSMDKSDVEAVIFDLNLHASLVHIIQHGVEQLREQETGSAQQLSDKFKNDGSVTFSFGGLSTFFSGLEGLVGSPNPRLHETMQKEHCDLADSTEWFPVYGNVVYAAATTIDDKPCTMSLCEWHIIENPTNGLNDVNEVLREKGRKPVTYWPLEWEAFEKAMEGMSAKEAKEAMKSKGMVRKKEPLATFEHEAYLRKIKQQLTVLKTPNLQTVEIVAARLYTGPMVRQANRTRDLASNSPLPLALTVLFFWRARACVRACVCQFVKYNSILRAAGENAPIEVKRKAAKLCLRNQYTTTLHVINSSVVKLGKLTQSGTVYRGITGGVLPEEFWEENEYGVCGGVEYAFMSTTLDKQVAFDYASGASSATILEIKMGMVDRGADVSWLSQYPGEKEILVHMQHLEPWSSAHALTDECSHPSRAAVCAAHRARGRRPARAEEGPHCGGAAQRQSDGDDDRAGGGQDEGELRADARHDDRSAEGRPDGGGGAPAALAQGQG